MLENMRNYSEETICENSSVTDIEACILFSQIKAKTKQSNKSLNLWLDAIKFLFLFASLPCSWEAIQQKLLQWGSQYRVIDYCKCQEHIYTGLL